MELFLALLAIAVPLLAFGFAMGKIEEGDEQEAQQEVEHRGVCSMCRKKINEGDEFFYERPFSFTQERGYILCKKCGR